MAVNVWSRSSSYYCIFCPLLWPPPPLRCKVWVWRISIYMHAVRTEQCFETQYLKRYCGGSRSHFLRLYSYIKHFLLIIEVFIIFARTALRMRGMEYALIVIALFDKILLTVTHRWNQRIMLFGYMLVFGLHCKHLKHHRNVTKSIFRVKQVSLVLSRNRFGHVLLR